MLSGFLERRDENRHHIAAIVLTAIVIATIVIATITVALGDAIKNEANRIDGGVIVDKDMDAGGTYYSSDKNGGYMRSYPPSYSFTIRGEKDGEIVEYTFEVAADEYAAYKIGDQYHR